uniref:NAD(P)(+)--arginine ADP-ribosyltransferase n=1 Tax=Myripristis murdjan TaxID=586833 RepID=A0A667ZVC9_9TELE
GHKGKAVDAAYVCIYFSFTVSSLYLQRSKTAEVSLDMAADSIDDMYHGCQSEVADMIEQFGIFEWHINPNLSIAWALSEERAAKPVDKDLREEHATVLYLHTNVKFKQIQQDFSQAAKWGRSKYSTVGFQYHYLYFHLTEATQILRQNQNSCRTTYLRTRTRLSQNVVNQEMRFGIFTLTASSKYSFVFSGNVSCFEIYTCFGAEITHYSSIKQDGQVLIPPYEVFRITDVLTKSQWCSVVYKLQSTKTPRSDLNCISTRGVMQGQTDSVRDIQQACC